MPREGCFPAANSGCWAAEFVVRRAPLPRVDQDGHTLAEPLPTIGIVPLLITLLCYIRWLIDPNPFGHAPSLFLALTEVNPQLCRSTEYAPDVVAASARRPL